MSPDSAFWNSCSHTGSVCDHKVSPPTTHGRSRDASSFCHPLIPERWALPRPRHVVSDVFLCPAKTCSRLFVMLHVHHHSSPFSPFSLSPSISTLCHHLSSITYHHQIQNLRLVLRHTFLISAACNFSGRFSSKYVHKAVL
jgi:hypothetical protein